MKIIGSKFDGFYCKSLGPYLYLPIAHFNSAPVDNNLWQKSTATWNLLLHITTMNYDRVLTIDFVVKFRGFCKNSKLVEFTYVKIAVTTHQCCWVMQRYSANWLNLEYRLLDFNSVGLHLSHCHLKTSRLILDEVIWL